MRKPALFFQCNIPIWDLSPSSQMPPAIGILRFRLFPFLNCTLAACPEGGAAFAFLRFAFPAMEESH
jgi:hypothetical protein